MQASLSITNARSLLKFMFTCQCRRCSFNPWVGKIPWRWAWLPTPVFLPGKSHGQRSLGATVHRVTKSQTQLSVLCISVCVYICVCVYLYCVYLCHFLASEQRTSKVISAVKTFNLFIRILMALSRKTQNKTIFK